MSAYQSLTNYSGTLYGRPHYEGIEYDWEVPDNLVVGSPGGVSTIHHHYTKGFDGRGNTSSDVFAGQGERYNAGVYGNIYQTGQEAGQHMGYYSAAPDYQFWQNEEPSQAAYSTSVAADWAPSMTTYGQPGAYETTPIENYTPEIEDSDYELFEPADGAAEGQSDVVEQTTVAIPTVAPWILFLFFILAFIAFDFWAEAGHLFIRQKLHSGEAPSWQQALLYAIIITAIFAFILWISGIPITEFETL